MKACLPLVIRYFWQEASSVQRRLGPLLTQEYSSGEGQKGSTTSPLPEARGEVDSAEG